MSFNQFFFNPGVMRQNFRQHGWIGIIYALGLLFALPVQMLLGNSDTEPREVQHLFEIGNNVQQLFIIIFPVAAGLFLFRYLQAKPAADYLHSLPLRRGHILTAHLFGGLLLLLIPVWLTGALAAVLRPWGGNMYIFTGADVWIWTLTVSILTVFLFSFSVFVAVCTGQSILQGIVTYILLILPAVLIELIHFHLSKYLYGYPGSYTVTGTAEGWSPVLHILNLQGNEFTTEELWIYAAAALLFILLSYLLYRKRQTEKAGQALAFTYFNPLFRVGVMLCAMLVSGNYLAEMKQGRMSWTIAGYVLGALIGYISSEMVIRKTWQIMTRRLPAAFAVYAVLTGLLLYIPASGLTGYEARVPAADKIDSVYAGSYYRMYNEVGNNLGNYVNPAFADADPLSGDKSYIAAVRKLHLAVEALRPENKSGARYDYSAYKRMSIVYDLKNGRKLMREYLVPIKGFEPELKTVMEAESYKRAEYVLSQMDQDIGSVQLNNRNKQVVIADPGEVAEFKAILMREILGMSFEEQTDGKLALAYINMTINLGQNRSGSFFPYQWLPSYHELGDWLEAKGYAPRVLTSAKEVESAEIVKVGSSTDLLGKNGVYDVNRYFKQAQQEGRAVAIKDKVQLASILDGRLSNNFFSEKYMVKLKYSAEDYSYYSLIESEITSELKRVLP